MHPKVRLIFTIILGIIGIVWILVITGVINIGVLGFFILALMTLLFSLSYIKPISSNVLDGENNERFKKNF